MFDKWHGMWAIPPTPNSEEPKILNPKLYAKNKFSPVPGAIYDNQPKQVDIPEDYPADDVEGNDDVSQKDEWVNPYTAVVKYRGKLVSQDGPSISMLRATGKIGDTVEFRFHFREFARLEIHGKWYRISDPDALLWRAHFKFRKINDTLWDNNGSEFGKNNQGW